MRISDWSSDGCSSDLMMRAEIHPLDLGTHHVRDRVAARAANADHGDTRGQLVGLRSEEFDAHRCSPPFPGYSGDSTCPTPFALCVSGTLVKTGAPEHKSLIIRFNSSHQQNGRESCRERVCHYV